MDKLQKEYEDCRDAYYERFHENYGIDITGSETFEEAITTMKHCIEVGRKARKEELIPGALY